MCSWELDQKMKNRNNQEEHLDHIKSKTYDSIIWQGMHFHRPSISVTYRSYLDHLTLATRLFWEPLGLSAHYRGNCQPEALLPFGALHNALSLFRKPLRSWGGSNIPRSPPSGSWTRLLASCLQWEAFKGLCRTPMLPLRLPLKMIPGVSTCFPDWIYWIT